MVLPDMTVLLYLLWGWRQTEPSPWIWAISTPLEWRSNGNGKTWSVLIWCRYSPLFIKKGHNWKKNILDFQVVQMHYLDHFQLHFFLPVPMSNSNPQKMEPWWNSHEFHNFKNSLMFVKFCLLLTFVSVTFCDYRGQHFTKWPQVSLGLRPLQPKPGHFDCSSRRALRDGLLHSSTCKMQCI